MICGWKSLVLNTTYENTVFLLEWSIYGIVCLTWLFLLTPLTHLKQDWINSGTIKILFMISEHSYREPEVRVKFCTINFSKLVYCKVFLWCGHRGFKPALVNSVYVYVLFIILHLFICKLFCSVLLRHATSLFCIAAQH